MFSQHLFLIHYYISVVLLLLNEIYFCVVLLCFHNFRFLFRFNFVLYWCVFTAFGFLSDLFSCCTAVFSQLCILFRIAFCVVLLCLHLSPFIQIYFYYVLLCFDSFHFLFGFIFWVVLMCCPGFCF